MRKRKVLIMIFLSLLCMGCNTIKARKMNQLFSEIDDGTSACLTTKYNSNNQVVGYTIITYDGDKKIKAQEYDKNQKESSYITYEYNGSQMVRAYYYGVDDVLNTTWCYEYDESNRMIKYYERLPENISYEEEYTTICLYDEQNRLIQENVYNFEVVEENLYSYTVYDYEDEKMIKETTYLSLGKETPSSMLRFYTSEYDIYGRLSKKNFYDKDSLCTGYFVYEYKEIK